MDSPGELCRRLLFLLHRSRFDRELDEEMRFHLEMKTRVESEAGTAGADAPYAARRAFGNALLLREKSREAWGWGAAEAFAQDLRYALRVVRKNPGFATVAVLTLALGIGANTAIFTTLNALVLRPLPFRDTASLVSLQEQHPQTGWGGVNPANYLDWRSQNGVFEDMALAGYAEATLTGQGEAEKLIGVEATAGFFSLLGVSAECGRLFAAGDDQAGRDDVVVLSHALWQRRFGGACEIVGHTVTLGGRSRTVVGVLSAEFHWFEHGGAEFWIPLRLAADSSRTWHQFSGVARLRPGVSVEAAQTQMAGIEGRLQQRYPENKGWRVRVTGLESEVHRETGPALVVLVAAVSLVLLIVCVNIAGLLLARAAARGREIAVRAALGAGRMRIVRQMLTESLMVSAAGGILGLALAVCGVRALCAMAPADLGLAAEIRVDWRVVLYAASITVLTGVLFGLAPALRCSKTNLAQAMKLAPETSGGRRPRSRFLQTLVVAEVALSVVLLVAAGLLMRTFGRLLATQLGIRTESLLTMKLDLPGERYGQPAKYSVFCRELLERAGALPGVRAVGGTDSLPLSGQYFGGTVRLSGSGTEAKTQQIGVTPGYFAAVGIALSRGRPFSYADRYGSERVAVVNDVLARRFWPGEDPVGRGVVWNGESWTIIAVAGGVRHGGPLHEPEPQFYYPLLQAPGTDLFLAIRTSGDPLRLAAAVRAQVRAIDAEVPVAKVKTMEQLASDSLAPERVMSWVIGAFSVFAVGLAAIGLYGVMAYSVSLRRHEIGVRIALGAGPRSVVMLTLRHSILLALIGAAAGVACAWPVSRGLAAALWGLDPNDVGAFVAAPALLAVVALIAGYLPARRAARVDPMMALRSE